MAYAAPAAFSLERAHADEAEEYRISHPHPEQNGGMTNVELDKAAQLEHASSASTTIQPMEVDGTKVVDDGFNPTKEHAMDIDPNKNVDPHGLRTATWTSIFFLITTDILGPAKAPWSFAQLGYVPGFIVYFLMGLLSLYCSILLWQMYMRLDEPNRRIMTYSDLSERVFGKYARRTTNILQSIQLLFNVAVIILSNAQGLSQIAEAKVCFIVLALLWMIAGMVIGQVRALQNFGGLSNLAVILNFTVIFIVMGVVHHTAPNYHAALAQNGVPFGIVAPVNFITGTKWTQQLIGVMQAVYAYGGSMIFLEMMAEMRDPREFIKSLVCAQSLIMVAYIVFGMVVYSKQGQFAINPANQGLGIYSWQTVTNVFNLVSALIAAGLYGNIGLKVIYQTVVLEVFNGPELTSHRGRITWTCMVFGYWILAFVICGAIPQLSNISGLIAAVCIMQFTFTFPAMLKLGIDLQDQTAAGKTWWEKCTIMNFTHALLATASLACAGLGTYSAVQAIIDSPSVSVAFGCSAPV